jgi:DNA-directed RNA polymerase specialized sigma24 family protein
VRAYARELSQEEPPEPTLSDMPSIDAGLLEAERDKEPVVRIPGAPARDQALLRMLVADRQPSYEHIGDSVGMPIGSIGPTRRRALDRLRGALNRGRAAVDWAA